MFKIGDKVKLIDHIDNRSYFKSHFGKHGSDMIHTVIKINTGQGKNCIEIDFQPEEKIRWSRFETVMPVILLPEDLFVL